MTAFAERLGGGHAAASPDCPRCPAGFPASCECGGWVHASDLPDWIGFAPGAGDADSGDGEEEPPLACDACGGAYRVAAPFRLDGEPHAAKQALCPGCPPPGASPCDCGIGLVHESLAGSRACDACGRDFGP